MTPDQYLLRAVFESLDDGNGNGPGHGHEVPGIWDEDNGRELAGKPCEWCATWATFGRLAKPEPSAPCDHTIGLTGVGHDEDWIQASELTEMLTNERNRLRRVASGAHREARERIERVIALDDAAFSEMQWIVFSFCPDCGERLK